MKKAMLLVSLLLAAMLLMGCSAQNENFPDAKLLLQVHDELIVECPEAIAADVAALVSREMQAVAELKVPLQAEAKWGNSWYEAK